MTAVFVSINARARMLIREFIRNGKAPVAELQNKLSELVGHAIQVRTKEVFQRYSPISAIPTSAGSSRTRWRFAFHSGPFALGLLVRMELAPQDDGLGATDPYSQVDIALASAPTVTVASANVHYGSSDGSFADVPWNFGGGIREILDTSGNSEWLVPDTEYVGTFYDYDHARLFAATVYEFSLAPDTDNGYPNTNHAAGGPVFDEDRAAQLQAARLLWGRTAVPLWHGGSESNSTARSSAAAGIGGALGASMGSFTLTATGTVTGGVTYTFDATITSPADLSSHDISAPLRITIDPVAGGGNQTNVVIDVEVTDTYSGSLVSGIATTAFTLFLYGWSQTGWSFNGGTGIWSNRYTRAAIATTDVIPIQFDVSFTGSNVGSLSISCLDAGVPATDQASGTGNEIVVDLEF